MSDPPFHLAQINVARMLSPLDHPGMAGFVRALDPINALADTAPGFVWRLQDESGNATALNPFDDPMLIVNMSVWSSIETLFDFVYQTGHTAIMRQRKAWFEKPHEAHMALWWIPRGHAAQPAGRQAAPFASALARTERLRVYLQAALCPACDSGLPLMERILILDVSAKTGICRRS